MTMIVHLRQKKASFSKHITSKNIQLNKKQNIHINCKKKLNI